jgi:cysteine desulfuration protein SufE
MTHPAHIQDLIDDFAFLEDWEDRYVHVIELGKALPPLEPHEMTDSHKVKGCASQVWLISEPSGGTLMFRGDSDAHIVKGLVAIVLMLYSGQTPSEILKIDAIAIFKELGLSEHLSMQRSNGLAAMVARIKRDAREAH